MAFKCARGQLVKDFAQKSALMVLENLLSPAFKWIFSIFQSIKALLVSTFHYGKATTNCTWLLQHNAEILLGQTLKAKFSSGIFCRRGLSKNTICRSPWRKSQLTKKLFVRSACRGQFNKLFCTCILEYFSAFAALISMAPSLWKHFWAIETLS